MFIGVLQFELVVRASESLKDKRRVVKSVKDRLHRAHLVSVAEVAALEHHRLAVIGVSVVSNSKSHADATLDRVVEKVRSRDDAELGAVSREVVPFGAIAGLEGGGALWTDAERRDDELERELLDAGEATRRGEKSP